MGITFLAGDARPARIDVIPKNIRNQLKKASASMLVGDPHRFAIEFEVDDPTTKWLFGRFGYRVGLDRVGDYDRGASLSTGLAAIRQLLQFQGLRRARSLIDMPAEQVFQRIDGALYTDMDCSRERMDADWEIYRRYHAAPPGFDVFDRWKCYLIEDERVGRFIWTKIGLRSGEREIAREQPLQSGEFDSVVIALLDQMRARFPEYIT